MVVVLFLFTQNAIAMDRKTTNDNIIVGSEESVTNNRVSKCGNFIDGKIIPDDGWFGLDDEKMTITGLYEYIPVEFMYEEFDRGTLDVEVIFDGKPVTEGCLREGMLVRIFMDGKPQGEYKIDVVHKLEIVFDENRENSNPRSSEFVLPVDNIVLATQTAGNLTTRFGPNHAGLDIVFGGTHYPTLASFNGAPVRAVLGGSVNFAGVMSTYGNVILITHPNGLQTRYAHLQNGSMTVSAGNSIPQGHMIGKVGNTPLPNTAIHLHFEVREQVSGVNMWNWRAVDPLPYLQGAGTTPPPPPSYTTQEIPYGNIGDIPIIGDWNGDGKDDIGVYRPSMAKFFLRTGTTTQEIYFGNIGDVPIIGDWNGNGIDKIGVYRPSTAMFYLRIGTTTQEVRCGDGGDIPIIGDWNGNGIDKVGVYRPSTARFYLRIGTTTQEIPYGNIGDVPIIGDWNGNGVDKVGVYRPSMAKFFLRTGTTTQEIPYGNIGDKPITGDWNGDGKDDIGVYRPSMAKFFLRTGTTTQEIPYGNIGDKPITGDWNGNGKDKIGVYRPSTAVFYLRIY
ncbi:MAG: M23 family metallopeptidase [Oscillospiraceae bacterium]|nr:M23 family metallopeptidase [Oscillospiraceae bacterium]